MKECILYDGKLCDDCGECLRCDLDSNKICDNCGKCIGLEAGEGSEFLSMIYRAEEPNADERESVELTAEERALIAFLDAPIDLHVPDPLKVDAELQQKWERILGEHELAEQREAHGDDASREIGMRGVRPRRKR